MALPSQHDGTTVPMTPIRQDQKDINMCLDFFGEEQWHSGYSDGVGYCRRYIRDKMEGKGGILGQIGDFTGHVSGGKGAGGGAGGKGGAGGGCTTGSSGSGGSAAVGDNAGHGAGGQGGGKGGRPERPGRRPDGRKRLAEGLYWDLLGMEAYNDGYGKGVYDSRNRIQEVLNIQQIGPDKKRKADGEVLPD